MKNNGVFSFLHSLALLAALLTWVDVGSGGSLFENQKSKIRNWQPLGLSGGGGMFSPAISPVDPNLMMVNCDMSAAYISEDGGHHWRMIHQAQLRTDTQCRPGFHPFHANVIYASSQGRLKISHDRGRTFARIGNLTDSLSGEIAIDPTDPRIMLVGTCNGRCHVSRDSGVTWVPCPGPQGRVIGFHFARRDNERIMFAATEQGIWRSNDGGVTWTASTSGLPWKEIKGFGGGSCVTGIMLYCTVMSKLENGTLRGGIYRSRDLGQTWQLAMGRGINVDTIQVDKWSFGPISQYKQVLVSDARPLTLYVTNTSTGFHPPHHETVYRSDNGGDTWRATFFQDPRFAEYNVAPNYVTASAGQSYKGGEPPFDAAICNSDPNRFLLVWSQSYLTHNGGNTWFNGDTYSASGQKSRPGSPWACTGLVVTTTWNCIPRTFLFTRRIATSFWWGRATQAGAINPAASTAHRTAARLGNVSDGRPNRRSEAIFTRPMKNGFI